ncbi:MAG TPA: heme ABC exporter ATP-binding protein CcmA [Terriglobia bacterium]|nr:heme ABC exporter ATP-binding protein CcmA [Terriglobia bacterium]
MLPDQVRAEWTLEAREVSKFFGDLVALRRVSMRVTPGDSVLLYGPNGAGKTTLLRTLAALARPNEGEVLFAGESLARNRSASKAHVGFVSHATFLYGELTARENLRFFGTLFGLGGLERKTDRALDLFSLRGRDREPVRTLSRGLQQRVTLARAFLHEPDFLLLDEPFTGLDASATTNLEDVLRRLPEEGRAVVFSTHSFEQGAAIAQRLVALENGQVRYDGPLSLAPLESLGINAVSGKHSLIKE